MGRQFDMVFEGGGAKGMVFVGALRALAARGHTPGRLIGTSAGAITATLLAVGYTAAEMERELSRREDGNPVFATFMDAPTFKNLEQDIENSVTMKLLTKIDLPGAFDAAEKAVAQKILNLLLEHTAAYRTIFSFVEQGGLYAGDAFLHWFRDRLNAKGAGFAELRLAQLHEETRRDLSLVVTDTTSHEMRVLNHRTAPNCPVAWAVRMSMSIPFAWQEVRWRQEWGTYQLFKEDGVTLEDSKDLTGHAIVDGGVLSNFPINLLTSNESTVSAFMGDTVADRNKVLGLLIDETRKVEGAPPPPTEDTNDDEGLKGDLKKLRTVARIRRLLDTMLDAHDKQTIAANADLICRLPAKTYGTMEFDMSDERKAALIKAGEKAMAEHLARR